MSLNSSCPFFLRDRSVSEQWTLWCSTCYERKAKISGTPNAVIAKGRNRGKTPSATITTKENALDSLFKEVIWFSKWLEVGEVGEQLRVHISQRQYSKSSHLKQIGCKIRGDFLGRGCDEALFSEKKGFSVKRGEAIQWIGGLVRISTGKTIQWRGSGHSLNRRTLKTEKLLSSSPSRKSALIRFSCQPTTCRTFCFSPVFQTQRSSAEVSDPPLQFPLEKLRGLWWSRTKKGIHKRGIHEKGKFPGFTSPISGHFMQQFLIESFRNCPEHGYLFGGNPFGPRRFGKSAPFGEAWFHEMQGNSCLAVTKDPHWRCEPSYGSRTLCVPFES